jgi:hypothetical protein
LYNEITRESTYLVMMPAKSIHTAAWEITPILFTVVKWARAVRIQVPLKVVLCLGPEAKEASNKLFC